MSQVLILLGLLWPLSLAFAQGPSKPGIAPLRLGQSATIKIDAVLDEPSWQDAPLLGPLTLTEPVEGGKPVHPTDVRMAYDQDFLYVGIICYDDPAQVRAKQMERDRRILGDDSIQLWIDTFNDQRFAFWFTLSAGGARGDALISDSGSTFNKSWDGIWNGRARVSERGWEAEFAIPFKTLSFEDGMGTWGLNVRRKRVVNGEDARWARPLVAYRFFNLAEGGELTGLHDIRQGLALDITPYIKGGLENDSLAGSRMDDLDVGLDVSWRPTSSTALRFTTNTDFAETEVDERQVNLSRFPLFFPEKRDFFLEDAGVFEFGPEQRPFFSRTIGRGSDGAPIPILAGLKFTGRVGDWNLGLLETGVDSHKTDTDDVSARTLGVLRASRNLGGESYAGVILTHGRPSGDGDALTYGFDFRAGSSRFFGNGSSGSLWGFYVASSNDDSGDGASYGIEAEAKSASWNHKLEANSADENYAPQLGFVRRTGVEHYRYILEFTRRGTSADAYRKIGWMVAPHLDLDKVGGEDHLRLPVRWLELELQSEDSITIESTYSDEIIEEEFELSGGVKVSVGEYDGVRHMLEAKSNDRRPITGELRVEFGDFFSGDVVRTRLTLAVLPSRYITWRLSYEDVRVDLDEGDFDTQLISTDIDFTFDPNLSWTNLLQFDTESDDLAWQSRMHYILSPGRDLFLVGQFGWNRSGHDSFVASTRELVLKLSYTWRL